MSWIVKPSATMKTERRSEPYLTPEMRKDLETNILPRYATRQGALIPALHMVQHENGWIPPQAMEEIGAFLGLSAAEVLDCASFYEEFWLKRKGRHVVAVCRSIACEFCNHRQVTDAVRQRLGIEVGETTDDGKWTLIELECLGACGGAPAALVDETLVENATPDKIARAMDQAKNGHRH